MTPFHLLDGVVELFLKLLSLDSSLALLLVLLVDQLLFESFPLVHLSFQPGLFLHNELLLSFLKVLLMLQFFLASKLFAQCVCFSVLALLDEALKDLFVLKQAS